MLKQKPERLTYAQAKLIKLIEERKLRKWCLDNGIIHSAAYRLALNEQIPNYKLIASMCHLISPIEWLYYTDEPLPFEPNLLPKWECKEPCKYIKEHRFDYNTIAQKYGLEKNNAYNIFVAYRANPSLKLIRKVCEDNINPLEFFTSTEGEIVSLKDYIPERGDIVSVEEKLVLVISNHKENEINKTYTGCLILSQAENSIELSDTSSKGYVCPYNLVSFKILLTSSRILIEKAPEELTKKVLEEVRKSLE